MAKCDYMKLKFSLVEARAEADSLRIQMHQHGCTCKGNVYQAISDRLCKLLVYIQYKENMKKRKERKQGQLPCSLHTRVDQESPLTMRPFLRAKIIKSYFYFSVSSSMQIAVVLFRFFIWAFISQTLTVYKHSEKMFLPWFLLSYLVFFGNYSIFY